VDVSPGFSELQKKTHKWPTQAMRGSR